MTARRTATLALSIFATVGAMALSACQPVPLPARVEAGGNNNTPTTTVPVNIPTNAKGAAAVAAARTQIGQPYRSGGESRAEGGFDCSGLTYFAWKSVGVTLPRSSSAQYAGTTRITKADLQPGDLVFYSSSGTRGSVSHVAIYSGKGKIIQAHKPGVKLSEDDLATWWTGHLVGYGRVKIPNAPRA